SVRRADVPVVTVGRRTADARTAAAGVVRRAGAAVVTRRGVVAVHAPCRRVAGIVRAGAAVVAGSRYAIAAPLRIAGAEDRAGVVNGAGPTRVRGMGLAARAGVAEVRRAGVPVVAVDLRAGAEPAGADAARWDARVAARVRVVRVDASKRRLAGIVG